MTSKYAKYILPLLLILFFAGTASALPTVAHDTIRGEMYVSSTANWPSTYSTNNFDVPNGTVVFARYYVGVWASSGTPTSISTTFNGHAYETNPSYYTTEMGVTWIPYDITDDVLPGKKNTATINTKYWGDGRQYGSTLVVVLKNESKPQIEYWVSEGCDWLHYGDYVGYEASNSTTYFDGTVNLADVQSASLYSTHLTGYNYEDFNGKSLSNYADSVSGDYFNYIRWDNVKPSLVAENQTVNVGRGDDTYCSPVFHALSIEYKAPDLLPVNLAPSLVSANTTNTMTSTIENIGNKSSQSFNVSLMVNGNVVDTEQISELASGNSTTVEFHWTPDGSTDAYSLTVVVDPENVVVESEESNNMLTSLVGTTSATAPVAEFSADKTSGDAPLSVTFMDQSTNSPLSWAWDFDNDGIIDSTEQNPIYVYNIPGIYAVKLMVTNAGGTNSTVKTGYIIASAVTPVATFVATPITGGAPLTVNFTDNSKNTPAGWAWDFDNDGAVDSIEQNPVHTYSTVGNYTVKLTVTNAAGSNSETKIEYISVVTPPIADFTAVPTSGNTPLLVTFSDQSTGSPTAWVWDFGDGTNATSQNPTHTYTEIGTYTVSLKVTNAAGSNSTVKESYITTSAMIGPVWEAKSTWNTPDIGSSASPCFADLEGDGDYDLLIGASDGITYGYENTGTKNDPVWTKKAEWNAPDVGNYAVPALADLDNDGDYDLLIGASDGITYSYENIGTKNNPVWAKKTGWSAPAVYRESKSCLADLDGDGDYDLLIGDYSIGLLIYYENSGTKNNPIWTKKTELNNDNDLKPWLIDLDGDGDYDLLLGAADGITYVYENTGTKIIPAWTTKPEWNGPDVGRSAKPTLADLDGDGDFDMIIGEKGGISYAYENTASSSIATADLTPSVLIPSSEITANTPYNIGAAINNTGTGNSDAFNATLSVNGKIVDTQVVSGVASGSSTVVYFSWVPEAAGDYNLTVTADPENGIAESDETNNVLTIIVTASVAPTGPDTTKPVIDSVVLFPANTTADSTISISVNATDDVGVTEVTAGDVQLTKTDGIWQGSITAPSSVGNYSLSINETDAAGNTAETSVPYSVVKLSGGANIAVSPRSSSVAAGKTVALNLKVKNTQNIDDTFKVRISVSELPASYQADLAWFNWTEKTMTLRAGEEVLIPMEVAVPNGTATGRKLFRANVNSETSSITGFDTGYLTIS